MAISFEDSLKAAKAAQETSQETETVQVQAEEPIATAVFSDFDVAAIAADDETWTKVDGKGYLWYDDFSDDNLSYIDEYKNITVDDHQINLTMESYSQLIPFIMDRYYDGMDLTTQTLLIHFVTPDGKMSYSTPINVSCTDSQIKFGWLVPQTATLVEGELDFEIQARGETSLGDVYIFKTRTNKQLRVEKSLDEGEDIIETDPDWINQFLEEVMAQVAIAQTAANEAKAAANEAIGAIANALSNYYTKEEIDSMLENLDLTEIYKLINSINGLDKLKVLFDKETNTLSFYIKESDEDAELLTSVILDLTPSADWQTSYTLVVQSMIDESTSALDSEITSVKDEITNISDDLVNIHNEIDDLPETLREDYYTKTDVDDLLTGKADKSDIDGFQNQIDVINSNVTNLESNVDSMGDEIADLQEIIDGIDTSPHNVYDITYEEDKLTLIENDEPKTTVTIAGGGGGGGEVTTVTIDRITDDTVTVISGSSVIIEYVFTSVDATGDVTGAGTAVWTVGSTRVSTSTISQGYNSFDITDYLSAGTNSIRLQVTDSAGNMASKYWTVNVVEFYIESTFDDTLFYSDDVTFRYTPYGDVEKTIYFVLDGTTIGTVVTSVSGRQQTYTIPKQSHGSHLLEVYMVAEINSEEVISNSLYRDIMWVDSSNTTPIISCATQSFTEKQYNTTSIYYTVYDPSNNPATITLSEDGVVVATLTVDRTQQVWAYKSSEIGEHVLTITCGEMTKTIIATIEDIGIDIQPVTTGLEIDFNPTGYSNNSENRMWTDGKYSLSVSDNFDWSNGGYQIDDDGDTYFCVKAGTSATFNYNMFADDAKQSGKEFKFVFKTENVRDYDGKVMNCYSSGIGFQVDAQGAELHSALNSVSTSFREEEFIELEFLILPDSEQTEMLLWTDGVPLEVGIYDSTDNFTQASPVPITIGSDDCDVNVYRMKAYTINLTDDEMLDNFIADAKNAEEMVDRYNRNNIVNVNGELDPDVVAERCPDLRIIKISAPRFTTGKSDKVSGTTVQQIYYNGRSVEDNWTATGTHSGQGTTSNQYGDAGRNIDIDMSGGFTFADGSTSDTYAMTEDSIAESYFNIKVNIASSENANNACLVDDYNTFNRYIRPARQADPRVRDTMDFYPCVIFIQETDTSEAVEFNDGRWHFYACGNFGNSKKNKKALGMDTDNTKEVIIELDNNTSDQTRFLSDDLTTETWDGDMNFEFRYDNFKTDEDEQAAKDAWQTVLTWVVNATPETFVNEFEDHFIKDSLLFFYLFTERHTMVDNRAKNTFFHTEDLVHWDVCFDYDNDTAEGNNNTGGLTLTYGYEDTDELGDGYVFNGHDSKLWCYIRDYFKDDLTSMFISLESDLAWSSTRILNKFESFQQLEPERLWIADMRRKYLRPYEDKGNTFFLDMMHGDKKHQRRQFEHYQEKYMASKYVSATCTSDAITIRGYTPTTWSGVQPSGDLSVTPYADTYINVKYGSETVSTRAKRGNTYKVICPITSMNDSEVYPYNASMLKSIGSIAGFYARVVDYSAAVKHTEMLVGSSAEGYQNTNMTSFSVGNNTILERLNLQNLPNLAQSIDLSGCVNLEEFLADGSGLTGVTFATGGKIATAHLPASILSITAKNLNYLTDFEIEGYDNITTLTIENCPSIDELALVNASPNLNRVRLLGIDWTLDSPDVLDRLLAMTGIDDSGYNTNQSVLAGQVYVATVKENAYADYLEAWPDLDITYGSMINQYTATFVNLDGTVLDIQYVDMGTAAVDPVTRADNPIPTPTMESTVSTDYTFVGWDKSFTALFANETYTAVYTESVRTYEVRYLSRGEVLMDVYAPYDTYVYYDGETPTYTLSESAYMYYLFTGWDKSGYVDGDKDIEAVYDSCQYTSGYYDGKDLSELRPVEIYAMLKLGITDNGNNTYSVNGAEVLADKDSFTFNMGNDIEYSDIESYTVIDSDTSFSGSNYIDTGLTLMGEDRSFVVAIDFEFNSGNSDNATLAQCFQSNGSYGFKLVSINNYPIIQWGTDTSTRAATTGNREMVVIRHVKGDTNVYAYTSNLSGDSVNTAYITRTVFVENSAPLVFGCARDDDGTYQNYASGIVHWAKVWYTDLGDTACESLAAFTHDSITMELCGIRRHYLTSDPSHRSSMSFLAAGALRTKLSMGTYYWDTSNINSWLNNRFYNGVPIDIKQLLAQVTVNTMTSRTSSELIESECYVYLPSIYDVDNKNAVSNGGYTIETTAHISYLSSDDSRIRSTPDGEATAWYTRSPSNQIDGYYWYASTAGDTSAYGPNSSTSYGMVVMFSMI